MGPGTRRMRRSRHCPDTFEDKRPNKLKLESVKLLRLPGRARKAEH